MRVRRSVSRSFLRETERHLVAPGFVHVEQHTPVLQRYAFERLTKNFVGGSIVRATFTSRIISLPIRIWHDRARRFGDAYFRSVL